MRLCLEQKGCANYVEEHFLDSEKYPSVRTGVMKYTKVQQERMLFLKRYTRMCAYPVEKLIIQIKKQTIVQNHAG